MANTGANTGAATAKPGEAGKETPGTGAAAGQSNTGEAGKGGAGGAGGAAAGEGGSKTGDDDKAGKTGETASGEAAGGKAGEQQTPKAPDKYSLTVPEANEAIADPALTKRIEEIARASDWTNDEAQAALNEALTLKQQEIDGWASQTKADPDYGGDKLSETQRLAQRAIDRVRPAGHARRDSFLKLVTGSGFGNHLEVVSFLADLGALMSEDTGARSGGPKGGSKQTAESLYDHPTSKAADEATRR